MTRKKRVRTPTIQSTGSARVIRDIRDATRDYFLPPRVAHELYKSGKIVYSSEYSAYIDSNRS